jgi:hypothetical protein
MDVYVKIVDPDVDQIADPNHSILFVRATTGTSRPSQDSAVAKPRLTFLDEDEETAPTS